MQSNAIYLRKFRELVQNQRLRRIGENETNFEKMEMDFVQDLTKAHFSIFGVVEVDRNEAGEVYICLYIDGPAPHHKDLRGQITRKGSKLTVACGRSYNEIKEQIEFLKTNNLLPSIRKIPKA